MMNVVDLAGVDLNLLVLFDVVRQEGHVKRAAARLHLSPSAVSHGLGRLRRLFHDPLFLKNPRGVVPTERAAALTEPIAEILAGVRRVVGRAEPFDARASKRRFVIGTSDGVWAVLQTPFLRDARRRAPGIDVGIRNVLPPWTDALSQLDVRAYDIAIVPSDEIPARFVARTLYEESFVVAMRRGHPIGRAPSLERYCAAEHVVVSLTGDPFGNVDRALASRGAARRVAVVVPNFLLALAVAAETDILAAVPESLVRAHGARFGLTATALPVAAERYAIRAVVPRAALSDAGITWLADTLARGASALGLAPEKRGARRR